MNWLILRGLVREQRHWGNFASEFEAKLKTKDPNARVYCIDFPGFGTESERASPASIDGIVDDLRARWKTMVGDQSESCLMAVSLGGMVAMNWVARFPSDFKRLVLINSSVSGLSPIHHRLQPRNYLTILSLFAETDLAAREETILKMTSNLKGEALKKQARYNASVAKVIRKKDALSQIFAATRFRPPSKIEIPVLVLAAKGDTLVHYSCSEKIAEHFSAEIQYHETANHDLALDDSEWVSERIKEWV
jgi:hypothetical protein